MPDMEELIKRKVNQITDLKERVAFKDIVEQIFLSLYETNKEMYSVLEHRIMDDLAFDINRYRICTGIVEKEYVDRSHHLLTPMWEQDLAEKVYDTRSMGKEFLEKGFCYVKTLFMECDFTQIQKLLQKETFSGRIRTDKAEYPAEFALKISEAYLKEIAHLYEVFISNGIPWQTVNAPYLHKFVDVYLVSDGILSLPAGERIVEIEPHLAEFEAWAHENYIPIWNIRRTVMEGAGFPVPCEDHKSYEHTISLKEQGDEHVYLIDDVKHVISVRQTPNRLMIMGDEPDAKRWKIYVICSGENRKFEHFTYPIMTNQRKDEFVERFFKRQGKNVKTASELTRFIRGFELEEYVAFEGYELTDKSGRTPETYSMNSFIIDEIRDHAYKKCLLLKFRGRGEHEFLFRDVMSFLVSEVQLLYPEYACEGVLL
ncbi:MAG: hypothetical protein HFI44_11430 [Lachnospiraceae bacterium]|nr:hypothetical protein [Lachnospiraceae bacterium]